MGSKKGRGTKVLTMQQDESQNHSEVFTLSTIDKASFLEGLQKNDGNPLHSTAVEEDLDILDEEQMDEGKLGRNVPQTMKPTQKQRGAAVKRKQTETGGENDTKEERGKRSRSTVETDKGRSIKRRVAKKKKGETGEERAESESNESAASTSPQKSDEPAPAANSHKQLVGKKPAKKRSAAQKSAVRPVKNKQVEKEMKRKNKSSNGRSSHSHSESQEECQSATAQQRRKKVLSSEEEVDEDTSWNPSPKKAKMYSLSTTRRSSSDRTKSKKSGSASEEADKASVSGQRKKRQAHQGRTDLEVVLDALLDFCGQYRESVESKAVKQSIDCFSNNVKEQLLEKISSYKELRILKRENAKVDSLIRRKTQRLLDAKNELMRAERQVWLLQKDKAELKLRLADLRRGHAFLRDIQEVNRQYLDYRDKHPKEEETYGSSSLPALHLEAKHMQRAEHQQLKNDGT